MYTPPALGRHAEHKKPAAWDRGRTKDWDLVESVRVRHFLYMEVFQALEQQRLAPGRGEYP